MFFVANLFFVLSAPLCENLFLYPMGLAHFLIIIFYRFEIKENATLLQTTLLFAFHKKQMTAWTAIKD